MQKQIEMQNRESKVNRPINFVFGDDKSDRASGNKMNCIVSEEDFMNNKYDEERFNKETLKKMKNMNLDKLHDYLSEAFEYVNIIRD